MQSPIVQSYPACSDTSTSAIWWSSRSKLDEWQRFARDGLGLHVERAEARRARAAHRPHQRRLIVREGAAEDVVAIGWQLRRRRGAAAGAGAAARRSGIECARSGAEAAAQRGVERFWAFDGPEAAALRAVHAAAVLGRRRSTCRPAASSPARMGMGHFAMTTREPEAALALLPGHLRRAHLGHHRGQAQRRDLGDELPAPERAPPLGRDWRPRAASAWTRCAPRSTT